MSTDVPGTTDEPQVAVPCTELVRAPRFLAAVGPPGIELEIPNIMYSNQI